ncbi:interferon-induced 35 kDa -like protein [Labeo rohita]|uniref:Interferon-induced 35 kDa-like protein n=1 Tax=Labeo rohita TaxID=84645 RepID=A0A498L577_LABRO|nr:interferon-induced 35 kDa -like protein [Labeo rohita]RXN33152.1 interferon-induced 35 kDa -like protein [Labeo rohita]
MSSEDFSFVDGDSSGGLDQVLRDINKYKTQYEAVLSEQKILRDGIANNKDFAKQFKKRAEDRRASIEDENKKRMKIIQKEKISTAVPERKVVFRGETKEGVHVVSFDVNPRIVYPMEGGTALITFEEEDVAQKILNLKDHSVELGDCTISVQAKPIQFLVPSYVEMETQVCPRRILVSNLPKEEPEERVLDKLDIHFSRTKNGGGEVEDTDMLHDSGTVVITFVEDNIAKQLCDKQDHEVEFGRKRYKVKVTPFLNGEISQMKICNSACTRTVLLTGIPNIMDKDNLQDNLEIHFQKTANGGGEVEGIVYNPVGHTTMALFDEDSAKDSEDM